MFVTLNSAPLGAIEQLPLEGQVIVRSEASSAKAAPENSTRMGNKNNSATTTTTANPVTDLPSIVLVNVFLILFSIFFLRVRVFRCAVIIIVRGIPIVSALTHVIITCMPIGFIRTVAGLLVSFHRSPTAALFSVRTGNSGRPGLATIPIIFCNVRGFVYKNSVRSYQP